ncbi:MAG: hypothetical protein JNM88_11040 [Chitinophagaceae bacterium]|nr:hypothetical protein [Chitinophagaceae bacterium]
MKKVFAFLGLGTLVAATAITFSNSWIAPDINRWQMRITGEPSYYPALTIFILVLPPLIVLVPLKYWWDRKQRNTV